MLNSRKIIYVLMTILVLLWGLEYIAAKAALEIIKPLSLVFIKYAISFVLLIILKIIIDKRSPLKKCDIPVLLVCALFGDVLYYGSEYGAMAYLPVSVVTIILAFVPCVSIVIEAILYKYKPTGLVLIGAVTSVIGVAMVVSADYRELFQGKYMGYILALGAIISWNLYNFITKYLTEKYKPLDLTLLQQLCAIIIVLPYTIANFPDVELVNKQIVMGVLYLGIVSAFIGFLIYIKAIEIIGPTPCALFSNFLPVTSTFFGWFILKEQVSYIQLLGGLIVIVSGAVVIWNKGRNDQIAESLLESDTKVNNEHIIE